MSGGGGNRLARESSPYLLQHAHNPVEWYSWGEEALARARSEDRPILLSIGYSSCHWCHVMERESFEDEATAALMNEHFVSVKVDREERPDVDAVYMRAVQALTGHGGWPLTVFLTPAGEPFYGGTYYPPEPRHGMPSFQDVLRAVAEAYRERRAGVAEAAGRIREMLERTSAPPADTGGAGVDGGLLDEAARFLASHFDARHGGFGGAPKFPQVSALELLLHHHARTGEPHALEMVLLTLRRMARGGIRDHLAGGFHRYTVDARWLVPHFEKMLYDNALLLSLYVNAWRASGDPEMAAVARETAAWLLEEMRDPAGGFHSAWDADSEGEEGKYYVWSAAEVREVLGDERARLFGRVYDVSEGGNWEGKNILNLPHDPAAVAHAEGVDPAELERTLAESRRALLEVRRRRVPPLRDDKVLAGWNGMALRALAEAGAALGEPAWTEAARAGLAFVFQEMRSSDVLHRTWKGGHAKIPGFLEDYAAIGNAALSVHEATLDPAWLAEARWCAERVLERFWDADAGAFFDTAEDAERLVVRPRDAADNATPSGNSLAAELLHRAGRVLDEPRWDEVAARAVRSEAEPAHAYPIAYGRLLSVATRRLLPPVEVAVVGGREDPATRALHVAALGGWVPQRVLVGAEPGEALSFPVPLLEGRSGVDGRPAAYVCSGYACRAPATDPDVVRAELLALATGGNA